MRLGFHFKAVNTFVEWEHAPWDPRHTSRAPSVYRRALASGLTGGKAWEFVWGTREMGVENFMIPLSK